MMKHVGDTDQTPQRSRPEGSAEGLPLVVFPARGYDRADSAASLRSCAERYLPRLGTILFRGFRVYEPQDFRDFVQPFGATVTHAHTGAVWGDVEPGRLWVSCMDAPESCIDTMIADNRELSDSLSAAARARLSQRGLLFTLTYQAEAENGWQRVLRTSDRSAVEAWCRAHDTQLEWLPRDALRLERAGHVITRSARSSESRSLDLGPLIHHAWSACDGERRGERGQSAPSFQVLHADRSPIDPALTSEILAAFAASATRVGWEAGDVLVVDRALATTCIPGAQRRELQIAVDPPAASSKVS